ncbi:MAG TPA: hypothetical protein V6D14_08030 [Coleofasciculaceae cyanobacterium]|jgi:hypothetical protein
MSSPSPADPQPKSKPEIEIELLKQEYFFLQTTIEDYNKQIWVVKALGITGTGAVISLALQQKQQDALIAFMGCAIPIFFWVLESQWKHFQRGFYPRVAEIENILKERDFCSPAIFGEWSRAFKRNPTLKRQGYLWDGLLNRSVYISYVLEIGFLLILAVVLSLK